MVWYESQMTVDKISLNFISSTLQAYDKKHFIKRWLSKKAG